MNGYGWATFCLVLTYITFGLMAVWFTIIATGGF